jgi:DnaD/phage-associated family protein
MKHQQTIIRAPRDKAHPYFSLRIKTAQDTRLSFEARGALIYLLSKPGNWEIQVPDLMREGHCGRDRALRILKELREAGYLKKEEQTRNEQQQFNPVVLVLLEIPSTENPVTAHEEPSTENPLTDGPPTGEPPTENPDHTYKRDSTNLEDSQNKENIESQVAVESVDLNPPDPKAAAAAAPIDKSAHDELIDLKTEAARLANLKRVTLHFENNIQMVTSVTADKLKVLVDEYPADWITDAINEAVIYNARNLAYIEAILKRWGAGGKESGQKPKQAAGPITPEQQKAGIVAITPEGSFVYEPCEANGWDPRRPPDPSFANAESLPMAASAART